MRTRRNTPRSRPLVVAVLAAATVALTAGAPANAAADTSAAWLSGAAGTGVGSGAFEAWRGSPVEISSTWADNNTAMTAVWQLRPGAEFGAWDRPLDIAIGGIGRGETWQAAATGAYDARWRQSLTTLRDLWGARPATLYIRLAHEMNGNWYAWSVNGGNAEAFKQAWQRFRTLQQEIFPASKLVFSVNRESVGSGIDWRTTFPGRENVDVMGVDYYNQWPHVTTQAQWNSSVNATDSRGGPKGLQKHLDFARSVGLPLAVSEWSGNADMGDSPVFIENMYRFFQANAGSGAGQVLYEVQFNIDKDGRRWLLHGDTRMPAAAEAYRRLW